MRTIPLTLLALGMLLLLSNAYAAPDISAIINSARPISYTLPMAIDYPTLPADMAISGFDKYEINSMIDTHLFDGKIPGGSDNHSDGSSPDDSIDTPDGGNPIDTGNTDGSNGQADTGDSGNSSGGNDESSNATTIKVITIEASSTITSSGESDYTENVTSENAMTCEI